MQIHIRLLDSHKSVNGRPVEHTPVLQGLVQLVGRDGNVLQMAEHIRELQADEFHILFLYQPHNVLPCVIFHFKPPNQNLCAIAPLLSG